MWQSELAAEAVTMGEAAIAAAGLILAEGDTDLRNPSIVLGAAIVQDTVIVRDTAIVRPIQSTVLAAVAIPAGGMVVGTAAGIARTLGAPAAQ